VDVGGERPRDAREVINVMDGDDVTVEDDDSSVLRLSVQGGISTRGSAGDSVNACAVQRAASRWLTTYQRQRRELVESPTHVRARPRWHA